MSTFAFYSTLTFFVVLCVFFALLILIQKGRGGGISSAFGGSGGNTAFGSKTGDVLTWATSIVFAIFLVSAVALNLLANRVNKAFVEGEAGIVAPGAAGSIATPDAPTRSQPQATETVPPTTGPMSVVPAQNRNPQGIVEPAVRNPTTAPQDQPTDSPTPPSNP